MPVPSDVPVIQALDAPRPLEYFGDFISGLLGSKQAVNANIPPSADTQARAEVPLGKLPANGDEVLAKDDNPLSSKPDTLTPALRKPSVRWALVAAGAVALYFVLRKVK